jgi:hypothetical protein
MSTPMRLGCSQPGRGYAEKDNAKDTPLFASDYTRACPMSRLEICICQIRFSDSLSSGDRASPSDPEVTPGSASAAKLRPANSF